MKNMNEFDLDLLASDISNEMGSLTFKESGLCHKKFLEKLEIHEYLTPKLLEIAKDIFNYKGGFSNQYHVARKVEPGNSKEMFRNICKNYDEYLLKNNINPNTNDMPLAPSFLQKFIDY